MNNAATRQNTFDIYDEGVRLLAEHMGIVKTEAFIATVIREQFDYTKWHKDLVDRTSRADFRKWAEECDKDTPYGGDPSTVI